MPSRVKEVPWVVAGGRVGEMMHCTRCGAGFEMPLRGVSLSAFPLYVKAFTIDHQNCEEGKWTEPVPSTPEEWVRGRDIGVSSATIYHVMASRPSPYKEFNPPVDPDDFGRCYRLLNLFPEWKARLGEIAARFPAWREYVQNWAKLTELYESALAKNSGTAEQLYIVMRGLGSSAV